MLNNRSVIQKADLALSDLLADGGSLQPAQAQAFIRQLIDESVIMPLSTVIPMRSNTQLLERIKFGERVLRAGSEAQALSAADRAKPDLNRSELNAQLFKAEIRLNDEVLEDSIERANLKETIMSLLSERISLDMDEVIINGDTASADPFLAKFDGILKQASINVVNAGRTPISKTIFRDMLKTMPTPYLKNRRKLRFLVGVDTEIEYRDSVASRETPSGDMYLAEDTPVAWNGIPVIDVPLFPEDLGGTNDEQAALLVDPKNIGVGIWRQIKIETQKDVSAGVLVVVASLRFDVKYVEPNAVVKCEALIHTA